MRVDAYGTPHIGMPMCQRQDLFGVSQENRRHHEAPDASLSGLVESPLRLVVGQRLQMAMRIDQVVGGRNGVRLAL